MTIEESLGSLAAAHGERMRKIGEQAAKEAETTTAEMTAHLRDPLKYWRDRTVQQQPEGNE